MMSSRHHPVPAISLPHGRSVQRLCRAAILTSLAMLIPVGTASAQYRFGVVLGGTSPVGLLVEYRWSHQGLELQAGTWGLRDVSLSITAKQYIGSSAVEPYVGAGLWGIVARSEEGTGFGLIARLPVGVDWEFASGHSAGVALHFNRALALKRPDPTDRRPPRAAFVPLPEATYRWSSR